MKFPLRFILVALFCFFSSFAALAAPEIKAVASIFAPLQMKDGDRATGYAVEIVELIMKRLEGKGLAQSSPVKILPWKRAMETAKQVPNTLFFSISRTPERESLFHWIGEISPYDVYLYGLKSNNETSAKSLEDVRKANYRIGVQIASNAEKLLLNNGFQKGVDFVTYSHYTNGVPMLFNNRFAMLPLTSFVARTNICRLGYDGDMVKPVVHLTEISKPLWLAASKQTSIEIVEHIRKQLDALKQEGFVKSIQQVYLTNWENQPCLEED
jgi:polar amino acid transport system substrate-binding protein